MSIVCNWATVTKQIPLWTNTVKSKAKEANVSVSCDLVDIRTRAENRKKPDYFYRVGKSWKRKWSDWISLCLICSDHFTPGKILVFTSVLHVQTF